MKVLSIFTTAALLSMVGVSVANEVAYVYGKDPKKDAEYDISMGMAGIQQAAQDPKLLAQLFQDMQVRFFSFLPGRCERRRRHTRSLTSTIVDSPPPTHPPRHPI